MIHPHFAYADTIYDACNTTMKNKLQTHQHMALRAVLKVDQRFPREKLHDQTNIRWLDTERKERCCIEAYKGIHNLSSVNVNNLFNVTNNTRDLRSMERTSFRATTVKSAFAEGNLPQRCEKYWRSLSTDVCNADKLVSFKNELKNGNFFI